MVNTFMWKKLANAIAWISRSCKSEDDPTANYFIQITRNGFTLSNIKNNEMLVNICWDDVQEIWTYKDDLFSYDEICLSFRLSDGLYYWISERMDGFEKLREVLSNRFTSISHDWYVHVMLPPFARNSTLLWSSGGTILNAEEQNGKGLIESGQEPRGKEGEVDHPHDKPEK